MTQKAAGERPSKGLMTTSQIGCTTTLAPTTHTPLRPEPIRHSNVSTASSSSLENTALNTTTKVPSATCSSSSTYGTTILDLLHGGKKYSRHYMSLLPKTLPRTYAKPSTQITLLLFLKTLSSSYSHTVLLSGLACLTITIMDSINPLSTSSRSMSKNHKKS